MTTILEAYGALFNRDFHIPLIGQSNWLAFVEDFFATAVLVSLVVFAVIRLVQAPSRRRRQSRFYGSHTGAAWAVLAMIALRDHHAAPLSRGADQHRSLPLRPLALGLLLATCVATWLRPLGAGVNCGPRSRVPTRQHRRHHRVPRLRGVFQAPAHLLGADQHRRLASPTRPGRTRQDPRHGHGERHRGHGLRRRSRRGLHLETDARLRHLHRVRTMSVGLSGVDHGQATHLPSSSSWDCERTCSPRRTGCSRAARAGDVATLVPTTIDPDVLWSCTTCGACVEECPVDIEHVDAIIDMRRYEVLDGEPLPQRGGAAAAQLGEPGRPVGHGVV